MKEPLIKANRVFKYSITFQETNEESREVSDFSDSGFIIENETDEIGDILKLAQQTYGIYYPISFGAWESTTPEHNAKYFEKGIETYYALFIKNEDGTAITEEEYDFITFLLSDGNYNKSEFTDYAVGGVVLGALALGVGGLIAYYYFNKRKKGYPTGSAWTKEHYHDNEDEDYEVEPSKRKVPARNRKFVNGGGIGRITEKDFVEKKQFKIGTTLINLEKLSNPTYYRVKYIDLIDNEQVSSYGSPNFQDVIFDINETQYVNGGGVGDKIYLENPYNQNGGFSKDIAKDNISEIMNHVSFRKFGNEFRKHIDRNFTQENNIERVNTGISWSELASYIVGDGDYDVEQEQYENFIKSFNTTYTKNEYKGGGGVDGGIANENLIVYFESGKGESFIYRITKLNGEELYASWLGSSATKEIIELKYKLESKYSKFIFNNDHSDSMYYGVIVINDGKVEEYNTNTDKWLNKKRELGLEKFVNGGGVSKEHLIYHSENKQKVQEYLKNKKYREQYREDFDDIFDLKIIEVPYKTFTDYRVIATKKYSDGGGVDDYDYEDIGQFSMPNSEWKNYSQEDFNRIGRKIVKEQFNGDLTRAYDSIVHKRTYFVVSAKNDKVVSRGFNTEEEAKKEMYSMFEKTGDFSYAIKKFVNGGTTTTRPTTTPEVVPDTDTKPRKPKTPFQPKHIPKPKARKYDFILIKR